MARAASTEVATTESSMERVKANAASKVMVLVPPWVLWPIVGGVGTALHVLFGRGQGAAWSAIGLTLGTVLLSTVAWLVSHQRGVLGRGSATVTTGSVCLWVTICSVAGPFQPVVLWLWFVGGLVLATAWNLRTVIRSKVGMSTGVSDPLGFLFDAAKANANLNGARMATVEATGNKVQATMALPAGEKTVGDVQKRTEYIEGAMGLPPGTMTISADMDRADHAKVVLSDPRVLRSPIPWPGPSRPGASVSQPLSIGRWQDGDFAEYCIVGNHLQVMGKSGSGKSLGAGWNLLGELITRHDVAILAADLSKGEQTLGALEAGMHRFEKTKEGVEQLIRDVYGQIRPRTDYLTTKGLTKWKEGCGLLYWVIWFEEVPKIFNAISDKHQEMFLEILKEIRSAGGSVVLSLQRADWTQMPTLARGQLSKMCFGVEDSKDAVFGITEAQDEAGARPELWGTRHPGMAYLDAPSIAQERIAMPLRTYLWDEDGQQLRDLCASFPAANKPADEFTQLVATSLFASAERAHEVPRENDDDLEGWRPEDDVTTEDPDPTLQAGADDPIEDDPDDQEWEFTRPEPKDPEKARQALLNQIATWTDEGKTTFSTADLSPIWTGAGMTRQWAQSQLRKLRQLGVIGYEEDTQRHTLLRSPALV